MRADQEKDTAALSAIILENASRQGRPVVRAASQKVVEIDSDHLVLEGIAWIDTTNVRAEGALKALHVLCIAERVVALRVTSQLRVVVVWREHQGGAAAPSADHLCRNQLLIRRGCRLGAQVSAEPGNVHVKLADGDETAVAAQLQRNRRTGCFPVFVGVAQHEFAGLDRGFAVWTASFGMRIV